MMAQFPQFNSSVLLLAGALAFSFSGTVALAKTALNKEKHINSSLISAGIGEMIRQNCTSITPRVIVFYSKAYALKRYALKKGYSAEEIETFLRNKKEQNRVRRAVEKYLTKNGVVEGKEATYCALGRKEIAQGSLTGKLLRSSR